MEPTQGIAGIVSGMKLRQNVPAADPTLVAVEQIIALAEHVADGFCIVGCTQCQRLIRARAVLLEPFE